MAVTFTVTIRKVIAVGDRKMVVANVAAAGATTVGGDVLLPSKLGLDNEMTIVDCGFAADAGQTSFFGVQWDDTDNKVAFVNATAAVGATVPLAQTTATIAHTFRVIAFGKGPAVGPPS